MPRIPSGRFGFETRSGGCVLGAPSSIDTGFVVRILVALPTLREAGGDLLGIVPALRRLGSRARTEVVASAASAMARVRQGDIDLVVVDGRLGAEAALLLETLRETPTPGIAIVAGAGADGDGELARLAAGGCLVAGNDLGEALPSVVWERVWRARSARDEGAVQQRIERGERLNDAIVRTMPTALAVLDAGGRLVGVNPEFVHCFGIAAETASGRRLDEVLPGDLLESGGVPDLLSRTGAGETLSARVGRTHLAGTGLQAFDLRATRLDEEGRLLLVLSDVSERERLSRRIAELQQYNENIIQNMNSALLVVDSTGVITSSNALAEGFLGAKALVGRQILDWFPTTPREKIPIARTLSQGVRFRGAETVITRGDGTLLPIGISCAPLQGTEGRPAGAVAIFQDLSEVKSLQRQALQNEKLASIGQLAAGVAHEINNPVGFIHANLLQMAEYLTDLRRLWSHMGALRETVQTGDWPRVRSSADALEKLAEEIEAEFIVDDFGKALRESQEGAERIRHIVQDLREFSRQDTGEQVLADVNECLESTAHIVWTMMKHSIVLRRDYGDLPHLRCYPMQLKQVFMNLLMNAYQAVCERVGGTGESGEVRLSTRRRGEGIVIEVCDTGVGIEPEHLGRIFDPFFTTKDVGVGTGLGLSTSFGIVQRHGGTIAVRSEPGEGSVFEVWLPLDRPGPGGAGTAT